MSTHDNAAYAKARQLIEWRRYKEALKEAEQLLSQEPEDPDVFALISEIYLLMNEPDKALQWSNQALSRDPEQVLAWYVRVRVYYMTDQDRACHEALQEALRIDPYESQYYYLQANLYNKSGKPSQAKEALLQALELRPEKPLYLALLSYTEALLKNFEDSVRLEKLALRNNTESSEVFFFLGWAAGERGDYKLKETYMRNAVRLDPDDKQCQDEYLEALQHNEVLLRIFLWPLKFLRKMKPWQILLTWVVAAYLFRPLLILFIVLYILAHWVTKAIVHVKVFGWGRRRV
ncbi:tetratricopeptide repeat protein [Paenibacillus dakarensis]|uniref:tetratricopeptide repeat protein n=1 Tax=Paenibacillus dakarensis TaxID=1527293 RepID=UPI000A9F9867|nr:tetratricopeptide repeat protein [Paenibacillus dakarensis]